MGFRGFVIVLLVGFQFNIYAQPYRIEEGVHRIVFIGNSITYAGDYINFIDAYFTTHHPQKKYEIINLGLPSETVSGLSEPNHANGAFPRPDLKERLQRLLAKVKPDLVLACYGMNDGIYMPLDAERFEKFKTGIHSLHGEVIKSGAKIIHITSPIYEGSNTNNYSQVLEVYSDWLIDKRSSAQWEVIDIHYPMKKELETQRLLDSTFAFAKDGIHPNKAGHFIIAKQILLHLGAKELFGAKDTKSFLSSYQNGTQILANIASRQKIMKDAWLTLVGHQRPKMNKGLEMSEANRRAEEINFKIRSLLKEQ